MPFSPENASSLRQKNYNAYSQVSWENERFPTWLFGDPSSSVSLFNFTFISILRESPVILKSPFQEATRHFSTETTTHWLMCSSLLNSRYECPEKRMADNRVASAKRWIYQKLSVEIIGRTHLSHMFCHTLAIHTCKRNRRCWMCRCVGKPPTHKGPFHIHARVARFRLEELLPFHSVESVGVIRAPTNFGRVSDSA